MIKKNHRLFDDGYGHLPVPGVLWLFGGARGADLHRRDQRSGAVCQPLPASLVLTGIVVSVSVTAIMLALTLRMYRRYRTLDIDEIAEKVREEGK